MFCYYQGFIASKTSTESANTTMTGRQKAKKRGANVAVYPTVDLPQIGAGMRIVF